MELLDVKITQVGSNVYDFTIEVKTELKETPFVLYQRVNDIEKFVELVETIDSIKPKPKTVKKTTAKEK
ncbi:hypothetical protein V7195_26815, partial [Priestia megaterium]|uniref:hypothetical protein n=1 Tax=Priestia megaterium TaxID=1404 RepID=UPI000BF9D45B|nr:hypothetical protein [Priestia megaterium]PFK01965.1 hypothetical protein COI96_06110 [Priestia megaterium]PMD08168.1 hypothetical protein CJ194_19420 [Priestia megaterium]